MASLPILPTARLRGSDPVHRLARQLPAWLQHDGDDGTAPVERTRYRTIFISDSHLGTAGANAQLLLDFLKRHECETLYLVGDIVDGWQLRKGWYWPQAHNDVVRAVLKMAKHGTRVIYVPGNHDEHFRDYVGLDFGGIELIDSDVHVTADGRRLLVIHGDQFDNVVLYHRWLAFLGDGAYTLLLRSNRWVNRCRRLFGLPYWSLAAHMKKRVKNAVQFISRFEEVVAHAAAERGVDGVVCGHIHSAEIRQFGDVTYYNDGDWVESCTALVEEACGAMRIIDWAETVRAEQMQERARPRLVVTEPLSASEPA
ncbi:UDP-2,3-diacylglucosamine diphosphatase [Sphingomonas sp. KR1UV-12]|uniref:UDP-2,3-diacylglucosamine diphosphatase n=1 Tax=Sphingomonas aurea TaxID=3063994 RepID=A0ABT9ENB3_9SPHN|nr:UDP-2,3-diacylglucosamine diphosphatase [Sphingomonas sp. KR1UV-12]MDP1028431.1 UDP-2,3-diacylglucosamine diphosphatase [Sphingomonas sp. KR1UV-12]